MRLFSDKKGKISMNNAVDTFIGVAVFAAVVAGLLGFLLAQLANLSGTVTVLGVLFVTVIPILVSVGIYKVISKAF